MKLWSNGSSPSLEACLGVIASLGETRMARPTVLAPHFHRPASLWDPLKQKPPNQLLSLSASWWFEPETSTPEASDHRTEVHWSSVHFLCFTAHKVLLCYILFETQRQFNYSVKPAMVKIKWSFSHPNHLLLLDRTLMSFCTCYFQGVPCRPVL